MSRVPGRSPAARGRGPAHGPSPRPADRLAALIAGLEDPTPDWVEELLLSWRQAQREARDAYTHWHELAAGHGHAVYLAALDREERAALVYARVQRRALAP